MPNLHDDIRLYKRNKTRASRTLGGVFGSIQICGHEESKPRSSYRTMFRQVGLKIGRFANSLAIMPPKMMVEFRERVMGYINMEEIGEIKKAEAR